MRTNNAEYYTLILYYFLINLLCFLKFNNTYTRALKINPHSYNSLTYSKKK